MTAASAQAFVRSARVPSMLRPQRFGPWTIERLSADGTVIEDGRRAMTRELAGFPDYTLLRRWLTGSSSAKAAWQIVMDDSAHELRKHLPIWLAARGRVLVTGLGLGCVVRGLLANRDVDHIDVVEIDRDILEIVGKEFAGLDRVSLHFGDALSLDWPARTRWDFAWHDLWVEDGTLQFLHDRLVCRYHRQCERQGAWAFPRAASRLYASRFGIELLGAPSFAAGRP